MRWGFFIVYVVALTAGTYFITQRSPAIPDSFVAARKLEVNHLIQPGDIVPSFPVGQYLKSEVGEGKPIELENVTAVPLPKEAAKTMHVALPVSRNHVLTGVINANRSADFCEGNSAAVEALTVHSVLCGTSEADCIAIAEVPTEKLEELAEAFAASPLPRLEPAGNACR